MANTEWKTPPQLFDIINRAVGGFKVDAAADQFNHLLPHWYGPGSPLAEDALDPSLSWMSPAWCNPPYGKGITKWLQAFDNQAEKGVSIIALIPASVETEWWNAWVAKGLELGICDVIFLVGRVEFLKPCNHCDRTGACGDFGPDSWNPNPCCQGGRCEVCDGVGYVQGGTPRFPSAIVFYGPTSRGKIGWLAWKESKGAQTKISSEQDPPQVQETPKILGVE